MLILGTGYLSKILEGGQGKFEEDKPWRGGQGEFGGTPKGPPQTHLPLPSRVAFPKLPAPTLQGLPQTSPIVTPRQVPNWMTYMVTRHVWLHVHV